MMHKFTRFFLSLFLLLFATGTSAEKPVKAITPAETNVVILGDSLTWLGGDDCDKEKGWNKWFKDAFGPLTCKSYARSGATWTNTRETKLNTEENIGITGNDNVVYNQVKRLEMAVNNGQQVKPDLILIAFGTNDAWFPEKRPEVFDATAEEAFNSLPTYAEAQPCEVRTLAQSIFYTCRMLRESYPDVRIVLITPPQTTAVTLEKIHQTGDLIEECGKLMGCRVVRMDRVGAISSQTEAKKKTYTYDGTHTNVRGARKNGEIIAREVMKGF